MITDPGALPDATTAEYLTAVLRRVSAIGDGRVRDVVVVSDRTNVLSRTIRLGLKYDGAADGPAALLLKTAHPSRNVGNLNESAKREVAFYSHVAPCMTKVLVPQCFEASQHDDANGFTILLEDLTNTHLVATEWPLPPMMGQCVHIVRALARFHAAWWNDPRLGITVGIRLSAEALDHHAQRSAEEFARFDSRLGDRLTHKRRAFFERFIEAMPRLLSERLASPEATLVHGDAHVWNCLLPRDEGSDDVRFFDWDSWRIGTGSDDLAYMMAIHWHPDLRRDRERQLLDHYHATLVPEGVAGYDRPALDAAYRRSVLWHVATPVWQAANGIPAAIWWSNMERVMLAADDLRCRDLLR